MPTIQPFMLTIENPVRTMPMSSMQLMRMVTYYDHSVDRGFQSLALSSGTTAGAQKGRYLLLFLGFWKTYSKSAPQKS